MAVNTWNYYTYVDGTVLKRSWAGEVRNASTARVIGRFSACEAIELEDILAELAEKVARHARADGLAGRVVTLKLRTTDFRIQTRPFRIEQA